MRTVRSLRDLIFSICLLSGLPAHGDPNSFNFHAVQDIPTAGPNCYFTALTVNSLLKVPAMMMSAESAALLFLNPALCETVETPVPGDLGLEEHQDGLTINEITHVFTFLGNDLRFEKASPYESDPFTFKSVASRSATRFVHCRPMQTWVDHATSNLPSRFIQLDKDIVEIENILDSRKQVGSNERYANLSAKMQSLRERFGNPSQFIQVALRKQLRLKGISQIPVPSETDNQYYKFILAHADLVSDPTIFAYMWLDSRVETISYIFENYRFLEPARLLP